MKPSNEGSPKMMAMAMRIGIQLVVATVVGVFLGYWLDEVFGSKPWLMIVGLLVGAVAGFRDVFRLLKNGLDEK